MCSFTLIPPGLPAATLGGLFCCCFFFLSPVDRDMDFAAHCCLVLYQWTGRVGFVLGFATHFPVKYLYTLSFSSEPWLAE